MPPYQQTTALHGRLRRLQATEQTKLAKMVRASNNRVQALITRAAGSQKAASSALFRKAFFGKVANVYEQLGTELTEWSKGLTDTLAPATFKSAVLAAKDISPHKAVAANAVRFSRERTQRIFELIHPDNSESIAALYTGGMRKEVITGLRNSLISVRRQGELEAIPLRTQQKLLQEKWDKVAGDLSEARFIDKSGRKWGNDAYLNMLTRTTSARIARESIHYAITDTGQDTARIQSLGDSCPICQQWDGIFYSITGANEKLPSYEQVLAAGMFHPNCDCLNEPVVDGIDDAELAAQEKADNPEDWKDKDAIAAYRDQAGLGQTNSLHVPEYEKERENLRKLYADLRDTTGKGSKPKRQELNARIEAKKADIDRLAKRIQDGRGPAPAPRETPPDKPKGPDKAPERLPPHPSRGYEPAETTKEAEDYLKELFRYQIQEDGSLKDRGHGRVNVDLSGIAIGGANDVMRVCTRLRDRGYQLNYSRIEGYVENGNIWARSNNFILKLNKNYYAPGKYETTLAQSVIDSEKIRWHPRTVTAVESIITHEAGHGLTWLAIDSDKSHPFTRGITALKRKYTTERNKLLRQMQKVDLSTPAGRKAIVEIDKQRRLLQVSNYAEKNSHEFLCEALAAVEHGTYVSPYAKEAVALLNQHFRVTIQKGGTP